MLSTSPRPRLAVAAIVLAVVLAACGDPPTTEAEGSAERPEECAEPSAMEVSVAGTAVPFEATSSVARRVDEQTWLVAVGDVPVDLGSASSLGDLPAPPADGTRVALRLHSAEGPLVSGETLTAADLGVGLSLATDGSEMPVTAIGAQATVGYVDDTTICGSLSVTDEVSIAGTFVASRS